MTDLGSHIIDVTRFWLGEIVDARAVITIGCHGDLDNIAAGFLRHRHGGSTIFHVSNIESYTSESYEYTGCRGGFTLTQQKSGYSPTWNLSAWTVKDKSPQRLLVTRESTNPFLVELGRFVSSIRRGTRIVDAERAGTAAVEATSALYLSTLSENQVRPPASAATIRDLEAVFARAAMNRFRR